MGSQAEEKKKITVDIARHGKQLTGYVSGYFPKKMQDTLREKLQNEGIELSAEKLEAIEKEFSQEMYCKINPEIFSDSGLTPVGIKQAAYLAEALHENGISYGKICASPVKRATQTASHIADFFFKNSKNIPNTETAIVHINGHVREKYDGVIEKIFLDQIDDLDLRQAYINGLELPVHLNMDRSEHYMEGKTWGEEKESDDDITGRVEKGIIEEASDMKDGERLLIVAHGGISEAFSKKHGGELQGVPGKCGIRSFDIELQNGKIVSVTANHAPIETQPQEALSKEDKQENEEQAVREFLAQEKYSSLKEFDKLSDFTNTFVDEKVAEIKKEHQEKVRSVEVRSVTDLTTKMADSAQNEDRRTNTQQKKTTPSATTDNRHTSCCRIS